MSTTRLMLVCHASTEAIRRVAFPLDEPLDPRGANAAAKSGKTVPRCDEAWCGPSLGARQTADVLGLDARVDAALDELDFGRWSGRRLADLEAEEPEAVAKWLTDPAAAPHGGESIVDLLARVADWLAGQADRGDRILAVTNASVIRAAIVVALEARPRAWWRIDVPPLSQTVLHARAGRWTLRSTGLAG